MLSTPDTIRDEFQLLGITKRYKGYRQAIYAIELALEDENRLLHVTEQIYEAVGAWCGCKAGCIERNIRTISHHAWNVNPARLKELAGYPLYASPTVSEFISIMVVHVQREMTKEPNPSANIAASVK